jgi:hypothetical protein
VDIGCPTPKIFGIIFEVMRRKYRFRSSTTRRQTNADAAHAAAGNGQNTELGKKSIMF